MRRAAERLATQSFPVAFPVSRVAHRLKWRGVDVRTILRDYLATSLRWHANTARSERQTTSVPLRASVFTAASCVKLKLFEELDPTA